MHLDNIQPVVLSTPTRPTNSQLELDLMRVFGAQGFETYEDEDSEGAAVATSVAIDVALDRSPHKHVLFLEDDVELHPDFAHVLRQVKFAPGIGVISLCDMREMSTGTATGIYPCSALGCDNRGWWGNQALLIHSSVAQMLMKQNWAAEWIEESPGVRAHKAAYGDGGRNCSDVRLSLLVDRYGEDRNRYAVLVPSIVRHVGYRSQCFPDRVPVLGERETRNWMGDRRVADLGVIRYPYDPTAMERSQFADASNPSVPDSIGHQEYDRMAALVLSSRPPPPPIQGPNLASSWDFIDY